ncbi:protein misato homolog 1-like isoform X2 [Dysidea avara]|uniref:protein misato homolog 1-like isoform X2 n=1 Tax=Dysidea avara TaxID=196820 RepID=UPI0033341340
MSEVINLQLGHYSNFVGSHRWNIQESQFCYDPSSREAREVNHHCTFREGKTIHGVETYTPRLIAVDLQGSLSNLKQDGTLYDTDNTADVESELWDGAVQVCKEEGSDQVGDDIWSNILTTKLHPNSVTLLPGYCPVQPFDCFPAGIDAAQSPKFIRDIDDRLHFFSEECDNLQGFQLLVDMQDGFGGMAAEIAVHLLQELYPKKAVLVNGLFPPSTALLQPHQQHYKILNYAMSIAQLSEHSSLLVPISTVCNPWDKDVGSHRVFPHLIYDLTRSYHTSAIIAAAVDTAVLPCYLDTNPCHMWDMAAPLTSLGRKVGALSCCLPLPLVANNNLTTSLGGHSINDHFTSLLPGGAVDQSVVYWSRQTVLKGIPAHYPIVPPHSMPRSLSSLLNTHDTRPNTYYHVVQKPLQVPKSFPKMFSPQLTATGLLSSEEDKNDVKSLPVGASLQSNSSIHTTITSLLDALKHINVKRYPVFSTSCLDADGWTHLQQALHDLADCYVTLSTGDWSSDSD